MGSAVCLSGKTTDVLIHQYWMKKDVEIDQSIYCIFRFIDSETVQIKLFKSNDKKGEVHKS